MPWPVSLVLSLRRGLWIWLMWLTTGSEAEVDKLFERAALAGKSPHSIILQYEPFPSFLDHPQP